MAEGKKNKGIAKAKKEQRRVEAKARQENYDRLNALEKLSVLDARLGSGKGAKKERTRLTKLLDKGEEK